MNREEVELFRDGQLSMSALEALAEQAAMIQATTYGGSALVYGPGSTSTPPDPVRLRIFNTGASVDLVQPDSLEIGSGLTLSDEGGGVAKIIGLGGSLTVQGEAGPPSYSASTLRFNQTDGAVTTQPSAGVVLVSWADASTIQTGVINTDAQDLAGDKTLYGVPTVFPVIGSDDSILHVGSGTISEPYNFGFPYLKMERTDGTGRTVGVGCVTRVDRRSYILLFNSASDAGFPEIWISGGSVGVYVCKTGTYAGLQFVSGLLVDGAFSPWVSAPASAGATGTAGQMAYDGGFFYICIATDTWKRVAIATW